MMSARRAMVMAQHKTALGIGDGNGGKCTMGVWPSGWGNSFSWEWFGSFGTVSNETI